MPSTTRSGPCPLHLVELKISSPLSEPPVPLDTFTILSKGYNASFNSEVFHFVLFFLLGCPSYLNFFFSLLPSFEWPAEHLLDLLLQLLLKTTLGIFSSAFLSQIVHGSVILTYSHIPSIYFHWTMIEFFKK